MENGEFNSTESQPTYAEAFPPLTPTSTTVGPPVFQSSQSAWPVKSIPSSSVTQVSFVTEYNCVHVCSHMNYSHIQKHERVHVYVYDTNAWEYVVCIIWNYEPVVFSYRFWKNEIQYVSYLQV